jgi:hypothetical protein
MKFNRRFLNADPGFVRKSLGVKGFFAVVAVALSPKLRGAEKFQGLPAQGAGAADEFGFFLHAIRRAQQIVGIIGHNSTSIFLIMPASHG